MTTGAIVWNHRSTKGIPKAAGCMAEKSSGRRIWALRDGLKLAADLQLQGFSMEMDGGY